MRDRVRDLYGLMHLVLGTTYTLENEKCVVSTICGCTMITGDKIKKHLPITCFDCLDDEMKRLCRVAALPPRIKQRKKRR